MIYKSHKVIFLLSLLLTLPIAILSQRSATADPSVDHCGTIIANETWSASDNVHVVSCDVIVASDATLTIEAGAIVKFQFDTTLMASCRCRYNCEPRLSDILA
jgi:hypothetical protein